VMTGYGTVAAAVEAMKLGALDFLEKPVELDDLFRRVAEAVGGGADRAVCLEVAGAPPVVGRHPKLRAAVRLLERVAPTDSTVLLTGESGTGKEVFARCLHRLSRRSEGPFVAVNCAAIPEALMENELFGHEKGAFTGADRRRPGRFEAAAGGMLFLDEIGELAPAVQGKVLRVLEERTFERVGSAATLTADVRLAAATNRPLEAMVADGGFRADLYYRLAVFPIELPPLSERASDVPLLASHLVERAAERHRLPEPPLTAAAATLLADQEWPGNVRQLANVVERAVILSEGRPIDAADLAPLLAPPGSGGDREAVRRALVEADGDKHRAAEILGISYRTLQRRVREHDLEGVPKYRS
jgi:DNA-binding NtrC family response regulator